MALPPLALVADLSDWIGEPITEEGDVSRAEGVLRLASHLVRSHTGATWETEPVPESVRDVVLQCAGRGYVNPEGWGNERLDDWGGGQRPVEEWGLYLTASEKAILNGYRPRVTSGIGVLGTTKLPERTVDGWVPTVDGPLFPWY